MFIQKKVSQIRWRGLFLITTVSAFLYVFLEWLFMVTKPSFMTNINWLIKIEILVFVSSLLVSFCVITVWVLHLLSKTLLGRKVQRLLFELAAFLPALILSGMALLLVDNFTYTVLYFGIINSRGVTRGLYALGFLIILLLLQRAMRSWSGSFGRKIPAKFTSLKTVLAFSGFLLLSMVLTITLAGKNSFLRTEIFGNAQTTTLPNILLITSDGLDADHMSLYGYERETTPYLDSLKGSSLLVENDFNNNAKTGGSIISMLTGKYPADTRVIFAPDILRNKDSYEHLPGILRSMGYYTVQIGNYAQEHNMLQAFDEVNGTHRSENLYLDLMDKYLPGDFAYFIYQISNRIIDRVRHIFFIKTMDDSILHLTEGDGDFIDYDKIHYLFELINHSPRPLFVQFHWLGTHGEFFQIRNQVFSQGKDGNKQKAWDVDFYDDSILEFDDIMRGMQNELEDAGIWDNTIVVVGSDHGQLWVTDQRIPLLFHFPGDDYAQKITLNAQNLDIAPTLLDYLGVEKPEWMSGDSLLNGLQQQRLIYSVDLAKTFSGEFGITNDPNYSFPPFFQFGQISIVDCNRHYTLKLRNGFNLQSSTIENYSTPCQPALSSDAEIIRLMIDHLKKYKFNTSTLEAWAETAGFLKVQD